MIESRMKKIEKVLFERFNTSFSVSVDKYGYMVAPNDTLTLAKHLEIDANSDDFVSELDKIAVAINILFI
jgi:hypothetical protein